MSLRTSLPLTVLLAIVCGFAMTGSRGAFAVLYVAMVPDRHWSVGEVTGAISIAVLLYACLAPLAGLLIDRLGVQLTMSVGVLSILAGHLILGVADQLWQVYVAYAFISGIGSAGVGFIPVIKMLSLRAGPSFGRAMGVSWIGQGAGALLSGPLVQIAIDRVGWHSAAALWGIGLTACMGPLVLLSAPGRPTRPTAHGGQTAPLASSLWTSSAFWMLMVANVGLGYFNMLNMHQVGHLVVVGFDALTAAWIAGAMGMLMAIGSVCGGLVVDRWRTETLAIAASSFVCGGILMLAAAQPALPLLALLWAVGGGFGRGAIGVDLAVVQSRAFAGPRLGRVTGLFEVAFGLGAAAGPFVGALSRDATGSYAPGLLTAVIASLLTAIGMIVAWRRNRVLVAPA
ncbi:MAG: MFS transporter [Chloroflexi bacterium]|nr:MFS transporter [Chloroflexota bacterium]